MKYRSPSQNVENDASQTRRGGMIMLSAGEMFEDWGRTWEVALSNRAVVC
jgi:hypothetical protein